MTDNPEARVMIDTAVAFSGTLCAARDYAMRLPSLAGVTIVPDEGETLTWRDIAVLRQDAKA
jgi:hypothetical protein